MWLFILLSIPLSFLLINSLLAQQEWDIPYSISKTLTGLLLAVLALVLFWSFRFKLDFTMKPAGLYYYIMVNRDCLSVLIAMSAFWGFSVLTKNRPNQSRFREYLLIWAVFFFVLSLEDLVSLKSSADIIVLFLLPMIRISWMIFFSLAFDRQPRLSLQGKIIVFLLLIFAVSVVPLIWVLFYRIMLFPLIGLSLVYTGTAFFLLFSELKGNLPYGFKKAL